MREYSFTKDKDQNYGEEQGPQYLGKKDPPNLTFSYEDQELKWRLEDKKTAMIKKT